MYNSSNDNENWQRQAAANGWTPPKQPEEKKASGCFTWVMIAALVLIFLVIANGNKQAALVNESFGEPKSSSATKETALPGSAAEAVQNGTLTMADIKHRADAIGWSTDAWQEWYYIASQTGTTMEAIEEAAKNINEKLAAEDAEFLLALTELGISKEDAKSMKPEELFEKVIYGLQAMGD